MTTAIPMRSGIGPAIHAGQSREPVQLSPTRHDAPPGCGRPRSRTASPGRRVRVERRDRVELARRRRRRRRSRTCSGVARADTHARRRAAPCRVDDAARSGAAATGAGRSAAPAAASTGGPRPPPSAPGRSRGTARSSASAGRRHTSPRSPLLHDPAVAHHRHPVGDGERLLVVVGDHQRGGAGRAQDLAQVDGEPLAQAGVEGGERLVEQQQPRLDGQRPGQRDPLPLAAGQRGRAAGRRTPRGRRASSSSRDPGRAVPRARAAAAAA